MNNGHICVAAALLLSAATAQSRQEVLQGVTFDVDTVAHYYIGPGVTHTQLLWTRTQGTSRHFHSYSIDIDRTAPGADKVRPKVEIGHDRALDAERVTEIAKRKTTDDAQYIAAINGDFFITSSFCAGHEMGTQILGYPNMTCAVDGVLAAPDIIDITSRENALIIGTDGDMWIDATDMRYCILSDDGTTTIDAYAVNYPRKANQLVLYNRFNGTSTRTDDTGRELVLRRVAGQASDAINRAVRYEVTDDWRTGGNTAIPEDGYVVSAGPQYSHAQYDEWLNSLKKGDIIKVSVNCSLPAFGDISPEINEICGGDVRILNNNVTTTEAIRWINTPSALYSRTMTGYSRDRNHLVYCCIDAGGNGDSGVSYYEGADVMRALGCWDALDLDGGGSTAMWTPTHGFINKLRDGSERAVGNGLFVRMDTPLDNKVATIRFADPSLTLPKYGQYTPVIYGYNKYGRLVDVNVTDYKLSAAEDLGRVVADGKTLVATGDGLYALTATYGDASCSLPVTVVDGAADMQVRCANVLLDGRFEYAVEIESQVGDKLLPVSPLACEWSSSDVNVATVDADGVVRAVADGQAVVTGTLDDKVFTVDVTVEIPKTHTLSLLGKPADWTVTKSGLSEVPVLNPAADGGYDIDYNVSSSRLPNMTLTLNGAIWSRPDALELEIDGGEKPVTSVVLSLVPGYSTKSAIVTIPFAENKRETVKLADISGIDWTRADAYPLTVKSLRLQLKSGSTGAGKLQLKAFDAVYDAVDAGVADITVDPDLSAYPVEYYTLQGQRVVQPASGTLVIERRGPRARKIVVR